MTADSGTPTECATCGAVTFPEFLTTAEVAAIVRSPESTVRYWRHQGTGPLGLRVGGRFLYPKGNVRSWLASLDKGGALA